MPDTIQNGKENAGYIEKTLFENRMSKELQSEYNLPDYLPDVNRILSINPRICGIGKYINGNNAEYDALICIDALYSTSGGMLKNASFTAEMSGSVPVDASASSGDAYVSIVNDSVSSRLITPRRISCRIRYTVSVSVTGNESTVPVVTGKLTPSETERLQYKNTVVKNCFERVISDSPVSVSEDIELEKTYPPIDEITSVTLRPMISRTEARDGGASYSGSVNAYILYKAKTDSETPVYIPLIRNIPIEGDIPDGETVSSAQIFPEIRVSDL